MYFEELKQALYLSDEYSIKNLQVVYEREKQDMEVEQKLKTSSECSIIEIVEKLDESGLRDNELEIPKNQNNPSLLQIDELMAKFLSNEEINFIRKELEDEELEHQEKTAPQQYLNSNTILEQLKSYAPREFFSQMYQIRYIKIILKYFVDICSKNEIPEDLIKWVNFIEHEPIISNMSEMIICVMKILSFREEQLKKVEMLAYRDIEIISCKQCIKRYFKEETLKSIFTLDDLMRWRFYGQIISFIVAITRGKEQVSFSYEEEAVSYIAYFLADAFMKQKQPSTADIVLLAKKGLKITNPPEQQLVFNILGVSAIDSGQKQLAYDTFFSWLNRCPMGELVDLVPTELFLVGGNETWRKSTGRKAVARMKGNFAYVCGIICDTYEPNSERWKVFYNIAISEILSAIKLNPADPSYHCTYGTLLTENVQQKGKNLLDALEQYRLYKTSNLETADRLDSLRVYCDVLLEILSEDFTTQDGKNFFQWAENEKIQNYFSTYIEELENYCKFPQDDSTENRELLRAQKTRKSWEPYFRLQKIIEEYREVPEILNLELMLLLIRNIVSLLSKQLRRWEYNLTDYFTRIKQNDQGITGQRNGIKPIAYYTTLDAIKFVFDDLYQELPNQAPRNVKEGEKGKNCLTVMHAKYMNDPYEGLTLLGEFSKYIEKNKHENILFPHNSPVSFRESIYNRQFVFVKSFTEHIDNLVMWNRYASDYSTGGKNSNGCCVQLDADTFGQLVDFSNSTDASIKLENVSEDDYYLYRMVYISKDGTIKESENPGLPSLVPKYYDTLRNLIGILNNYLDELKAKLEDKRGNRLVEYVREYIQQTFHIVLFLFKDSDYSDEVESRLIFVRTPNQQEEIRLLPTSPEKLCINPFFQVYISQIMFGPNVRDQELWIPYFQYQLNKMWRKHPSLLDKPEELPYTHYSIENSKIHYHT